MFHHTLEPDEELPEWVKNEKEQFSKYRDKNHDGFLDNDEVSVFYYFSFQVKIL